MRNQRADLNHRISLVVLCAIALLMVLFVLAVPAASQDVKIKPARIVYTAPNDGQEMYVAYCAACHGMTARGDGSAAPAFRNPPTDLTLLSKQHGGQYPDYLVHEALEFGANVPAHGNAQMPIWGTAFRRIDSSWRYSVTQLRIANLVKYLKTLQAK